MQETLKAAEKAKAEAEMMLAEAHAPHNINDYKHNTNISITNNGLLLRLGIMYYYWLYH